MNAIAAGRPMADRPISRRRMLSIAAGGATALLAGKRAHADADPYVWEGTALGAPARLVLCGASREEARSAAIACLGEVERLERQFSLYRPDSALSLLNRLGSLERPPLDLLHLFDLSVRFGHLTDGAFDITVQPLWRAYADYFAGEAASPAGPPETSVRAALARVDFRRLGISSERITLADRDGGHPQRDRPGLYYRSGGGSVAGARLAACSRGPGRDADARIRAGRVAVAGRHPGAARSAASANPRGDHRRRCRHLRRLCHRLRVERSGAPSLFAADGPERRQFRLDYGHRTAGDHRRCLVDGALRATAGTDRFRTQPGSGDERLSDRCLR